MTSNYGSPQALLIEKMPWAQDISFTRRQQLADVMADL